MPKFSCFRLPEPVITGTRPGRFHWPVLRCPPLAGFEVSPEGSGVIEAGCKTVIGSRLKQSGMFWTVSGANAIIALRCCCISGKFETYWEERAA
jgi:hypothetical protein